MYSDEEEDQTKWSLVQFKDGNRRIKILVLSKDVKGFTPKHPDDIPNREYMVKWEKSFHDSDAGIAHDGCYPAQILLFGATPEEIRYKAKEMKITVPDAAFPLPGMYNDAKPMKRPLRKPRRKYGEEDKDVLAKKKRMHETLALISPDTSVPGDKAHVSSPTLPSTSDHSGLSVESKKGDDVTRSKCKETRDVTATGAIQSVSPGKRKKRDSISVDKNAKSGRSVHSKESGSTSRIKYKDRHDATISAASKPFSPEKREHHNTSSHKDSKSQKISVESKGRVDGMKRKSSTPIKPASPSYKNNKSQNMSVEIKERGDDTEGKCMEVQNATAIAPIQPVSSRKGKYDIPVDQIFNADGELLDEQSSDAPVPSHEDDCVSDYSQHGGITFDTSTVFSHRISDIEKGNQSTKKIRKAKCIKSYHDGRVNSDFSADDDDEDDVTCQLDSLKKQHMFCETKIEKLQEKVSKLKSLFDTANANLAKSKDRISALKEEVESLQQMNFQLQRQSLLSANLKSKAGKSSPKQSSSLNSPVGTWRVTSQPVLSPAALSSPVVKSPPLSLDKDGNEGGLNTEPASVSRKLRFDSDEEGQPRSTKQRVKEDLNGGHATITQNVFNDLKGIKPLSGDEKKVYLGMGQYMNRTIWEDSIRKQKKESLFLKDCALAIWGIEGLKTRVADRATATKKAATPSKVQVIHAMLRGFLQVRGISEQDQSRIINEKATKWLGEKMYDVSREPKAKRK